jgi:hypothetical protein
MDLDIEMGDAAQQPFMEEPTRDNDILVRPSFASPMQALLPGTHILMTA